MSPCRCINCIVLLSAAIPIDEITAIMHSSFTACMHEGSGEGCRRIRQKKNASSEIWRRVAYMFCGRVAGRGVDHVDG